VEPVLQADALDHEPRRVAECLCILGDLMGLAVVVNDPGVDRERYPPPRLDHR
jgi:hypothetical protein